MTISTDETHASARSTALAAQEESLKARFMAQRFFKEIESLEEEIKQSKDLSRAIEERGIWQRLTSSTAKDLSEIAKIQGNINKRMVDLIQETIRLNMLSYAGLVMLMKEMRAGIDGGFKDANGNITRLGKEGRDLAETATSIISGILDSSQDTQDRIDSNAQGIQDLVNRLDAEAQLATVRSKALDATIAALSQRSQENDTLDQWQNEALSSLRVQLHEKQELDASRDAVIDKHTAELASQAHLLSTFERALIAQQSASELKFAALMKAHVRMRTTFIALFVLALGWLSAVSWHVFLR